MALELKNFKDAQWSGAAFANMGVAALIVAGLYFGRDILVPVALAVLLSFVLSPFAVRLQSLRVPRTLAVLLVVFLGFSIIFSLGGLMVSQASRLAGDLPGYQQTLRAKIDSLRGFAGGSGTLERASKVLKDLGAELQNNTAPAGPAQGGPKQLTLNQPADRPIPVEVKQPDPGALTTLVAIIAPLVQPLTTTGIVIIFVVFILLQRQDLRNRFIRLAGSHDIQRTTAALDDAGQRLSRLFLTQIVFNAIFGVLIGIGLEIIGVPSAPLWGLIAMIMRFVPYIGAFVSAIIPLILAAAVGSGWNMLLWTAGLFAVLELLAGQVIEPLVFGHSSGLSPVAIVVAASFWTWIWGPVGLVLATPLTICLVVVGRHVDRLNFLDVMLGDRPPLTPPELVYQRMLAGDPIEATEQAHHFLKDGSLEDYYDTVLLSGLRLAEADHRLDRLDAERLTRLAATVSEVVEDLDGHLDRETEESKADSIGSALKKFDEPETPAEVAAGIPDFLKLPRSVLCIPGSGEIDEAAAMVLAQLLRRNGFGAEAEKADALSISKFFSLDLSAASLVCVCYVGDPSNAKVQYAVRRLARKHKESSIVVARLGGDSDVDPLPASLDREVAAIAGGFGEVVAAIDAIAMRLPHRNASDAHLIALN